MLNQTMLTALNSQINKEAYSFYMYFSLSAYFDSIGLKGCASWMRTQSQEEWGHVERFYNFVVERNGLVQLQTIEAPPKSWKSPLDGFQSAYKHECSVSESIDGLVNLAMAEKDHATHHMLQWFVTEQVEEESTFQDIVTRLEMIGDNKAALFLLDNELGGRTATSA